jgi:streptogramin lyase
MMVHRAAFRSALLIGLLVLAPSVATVPQAADAASHLHHRSFQIPTSNSQPEVITTGPDGTLWFTEERSSKIARVTFKGKITEFPTPTSGSPFDITDGPDGDLWFTEGATGRIGTITPGGRIREIRFSVFDAAGGITAGPDGNIWFTQVTGNAVWRLDLSTMKLARFPIPTPNSFPGAITTGPDGSLWFVEGASGKIGRVTPEGAITEPVSGLSSPFWIAAGPDGNLWFTEPFNQRIGKVTPSGQATFYTSDLHIASIAPGLGKDLVFTDFSDNLFGTLSTDGVVTMSREVSGSSPTGITTGPQGSIWFLGFSTNRVYLAVVP